MIIRIIPLVTQLLSLSIRLADTLEKSKEISIQDKATLKGLIRKAREGVTYIDEGTPEDG